MNEKRWTSRSRLTLSYLYLYFSYLIHPSLFFNDSFFPGPTALHSSIQASTSINGVNIEQLLCHLFCAELLKHIEESANSTLTPSKIMHSAVSLHGNFSLYLGYFILNLFLDRLCRPLRHRFCWWTSRNSNPIRTNHRGCRYSWSSTCQSPTFCCSCCCPRNWWVSLKFVKTLGLNF